MEYKRREDEDILEYKIRLGENKDLYNLSWEEIKDLLNFETGQNYGESAYRKSITNMLIGVEYQRSKSISNSDVDTLNELDEKLLEIKKEKVKLQTEKLEYNKWIREQARAEMFEDKIVKAIEKNMKPLEVPSRSVKVNESKDRASVLLISDIHYGKDVEIKGLKGEVLNGYSLKSLKENVELLDIVLQI